MTKIIGLFNTPQQTEQVVYTLYEAGFSRDSVTVYDRHLADVSAGLTESLPPDATATEAGLGPTEEDILQTLTDFGLSPDETRFFSDGLAPDSRLVIVTAEDEKASKVIEIMHKATKRLTTVFNNAAS